MNKSEYTRRFDRLYHHLLETCSAFYSWKGLQNKDFEPIYDKAKYFWSSVLIALQNEWLINLAKCFENSTYSEKNKVVSVYALLKHHPDAIRSKMAMEIIEKHKNVISHVQILRHNQLAHLNANHLANPKKLLEKFPIKFGDIEDLISSFPELLSLLNPETGHGYQLINYTEEPEREAKHTMSEIQYFEREYNKHRERFLAGEIDDIKFPPKEDSKKD